MIKKMIEKIIERKNFKKSERNEMEKRRVEEERRGERNNIDERRRTHTYFNSKNNPSHTNSFFPPQNKGFLFISKLQTHLGYYPNPISFTVLVP